MKQTLVRLALIAAAAVPHLAGAQQKPLPTLQLNAGMHLIQAELANTFETRMTGLMHRKQLARTAACCSCSGRRAPTACG